jgi:hypothetical protein
VCERERERKRERQSTNEIIFCLTHSLMCIGDVPDEISQIGERLLSFRLPHNSIGRLPDSFSSLISLTALDLSDNQLQGDNFSFLFRLSFSYLFVDSFPCCLSTLISLNSLNLSSNKLTGSETLPLKNSFSQESFQNLLGI